MSTLDLLISLQHPQFEDRDLQAETIQLLDRLKRELEVQSADLVEEQEAPEGAKAFGAGMALGVLKAVVDPKHLSRLVSLLKNHLISNPQLVLEITIEGKTFKATANRIDELERMAQMKPEAFE